jgi:hypothetical protein
MRLGYPEQGMVFMNGDSVIRPWMELRTAYVHGCFQASLLIGQSFWRICSEVWRISRIKQVAGPAFTIYCL